MKNFLIILTLLFFSISCAQKSHQLDILTLQAEGTYNNKAEKIFVDRSLKETSRSNASFYLKKELLGRDLVFNDSDTGNYWKDRAYFKDTPIVRYIYKYFDPTDDRLVFAASVAEYQGQPNYIFDGMAFSANKKNIVIHKMDYRTGKLHGEFAEYNDDGSFKERLLYKNGQRTTFYQTPESLNKDFIGTWVAVVPSEVDWQETELINTFKDDGTIESYKNMYYKNEEQRMQTMDGSDSPAKGLWIYQSSSQQSGVVEFYMNGDLIQKNEVRFPDKNKMEIKVIYYNKNYGPIEFEQLTFKRIG